MDERDIDASPETRYARFARNAAGVSNLAAGGLALAAYFLGTLLDETGAWARGALATTPFIWMGLKGLLARRFRARHAVEEEPIGARHRQWRQLFTAMAALIGAMVVLVAIVSRSDPTFPAGRALPLGVYIVFGATLPVFVWRFALTTEELLVALFLCAQAALLLVGTGHELGAGVQMPVAAGVIILLGVKQLTDYRRVVSDARRTDNE